MMLGIKKVGVVGVGIMGSGIALTCAKGGYDVAAADLQQDAIELASTRMNSAMKTLVEAEILTEKEADSSLARVTMTQDVARAVQDSDLVIEAIPEKIHLKKLLFKKLDRMCPATTIFASNTSTFKITDIARAIKRPEMIVGTHWMNPPYLLPLVEVIPGKRTSSETTEIMKGFLTSIGKRPILCKDIPGFLVNRMHSALLVEVISLVEQRVASMEDIDMAWTQHLGPRYCNVGPFQLLDSFGLDTEHSQYSYLYETLKESKFRPPRLLKNKVMKNELGLKTGKGFYDYAGKDVNAIIEERDRRFIEILRFLKIIEPRRLRS